MDYKKLKVPGLDINSVSSAKIREKMKQGTGSPANAVVTVPARKVDTSKLNLKRNRPVVEDDDPEPRQIPVSAGDVPKLVDYMFNPTREKMREVTNIDQYQGRLFPVVDVLNTLFNGVLETALYRQSPELYEKAFKKKKPIQTNSIEELMYRTAQWRRSIRGLTFEKGMDVTLAEVETRTDTEESDDSARRGYEE